jgi:glycosyltransferase involved in cell wall biosynthesis
MLLNMNKDLKFNIEKFEPKNDSISIQGWVFFKNIEIKSFYIKVNNETLVTYQEWKGQLSRPDVARAFNSERKNVTNSGFLGKFLFDAPLNRYNFSLYIELENGKKIRVMQRHVKLDTLWHKFKVQKDKIIIELQGNISFIKKYYHYSEWLFYEISKFGYIKFIKILTLEIRNFSRIYFFRKYLKHKETILIITHDCSLTGAPILALNLVQFFKKKYNVVVLAHNGGVIEKDFISVSSFFAISRLSAQTNFNLIFNIILTKLIVRNFKIKFAIVNSIESRHLLKNLSKENVPTVHLVHEFASYTRPLEAFPESIFWADTTVFSSLLTYNNYIDSFPFKKTNSFEILTQGRCHYHRLGISSQFLELEKNKINRILEINDDKVIKIIGAGYVQYRKGVDLFIDLAASILKTKNLINKVHFYWVGDGFDPEYDSNYSAYLQDQILRYGIQDKITFVNATSEFKYLLNKCDIFVLTSRLDPFPNVAIDAMALKIPVLCFDNTTGIADFLRSNKLDKYCLANYLDLNNLKNKLKLLISTKKIRHQLGESFYKVSNKAFNFDTYCENIEGIAKKSSLISKSAKESCDWLVKNNAIDIKFAFPRNKNYTESVSYYVKSWNKKLHVGLRKPFPGFHPGIYSERNSTLDTNIDPLVDYLSKNKPAGPWSYTVINSSNEITSSDLPKNVAIHIHVYYPEMLPNIIARLNYNKAKPDLYISVPNNVLIDPIKDTLKNYKGFVKAIKVTPNIGRNFGPLLIDFETFFSEKYEIIGHIHTKKSPHVESRVAEEWSNFILDCLLGNSSQNMMDAILSKMNHDKSIGIVFPDEPHAQGWDKNLSIAKVLAKKLSIKALPEYFIFPVGSMFFIRSKALSSLGKLKVKYKDFPSEPLDNDGTILHALERILPFAVEHAGFKVATSFAKGSFR